MIDALIWDDRCIRTSELHATNIKKVNIMNMEDSVKQEDEASPPPARHAKLHTSLHESVLQMMMMS